jgi:hypothetical protein
VEIGSGIPRNQAQARLMERYFQAVEKIRELEEQLQNEANHRVAVTLELEDANSKVRELDRRLTEQSVQLAGMGAASAEIQKEQSDELASYKKTNATLVEFVLKVADSKSKYGTEAKKLLGG